MMDNSPKIYFDLLQKSIDENNEEMVLSVLNDICKTENANIENVQPLKSLLKYNNTEIVTNATKTIAELAKSAPNRQMLSENDIIMNILSLLDTENTLCKIQACRALANICYESDNVRSILFENKCLEKILNILNTNVQQYNDTGTENCVTENAKITSSKSGGSLNQCCSKVNHFIESRKQLRKVSCGLLFNLLMSNNTIQSKALELNILKTVEKILIIEAASVESSEDCITHLLLTLNLLIDSETELWISENVCKCLVRILKESMNPDVSELCLEILHSQAENDDIKSYLAKYGLCELLYNLLEKHKELANDEDSRALLKMACNLIVLVLTGDEPMNLLYSNGEGDVYNNMVSWLESDDSDLLITGVLAIGNFARQDNHCIKMVENGLSKKLLEILSNYNSPDSDLRLQHAVLSALRNLVIPPQNKAQVLKDGLIDIIYPLVESPHSPVTFKLLGTLRMVIDGQVETAVNLSKRVDFLEKLVFWCYTTDNLGVKGESSRLLAWLIKNAHSKECALIIIKVPDTVKCLVDMIPSQHAVMQIEALLALNLLLGYSKNKSDLPGAIDNECGLTKSELDEILIKANVGAGIATLLENYLQKLEKEVLSNLIALLSIIVKSNAVKKHLKESNVAVELNKATSNENFKKLSDQLSTIATEIDSV